MNNKPVFTYKEFEEGFALYMRNKEIASFYQSSVSVTDTFMRWLVDLLNKNHAEFTKERTERTIREMGF